MTLWWPQSLLCFRHHWRSPWHNCGPRKFQHRWGSKLKRLFPILSQTLGVSSGIMHCRGTTFSFPWSWNILQSPLSLFCPSEATTLLGESKTNGAGIVTGECSKLLPVLHDKVRKATTTTHTSSAGQSLLTELTRAFPRPPWGNNKATERVRWGENSSLLSKGRGSMVKHSKKSYRNSGAHGACTDEVLEHKMIVWCSMETLGSYLNQVVNRQLN